MAIKLIVDSAADIIPAEAEKLGIIHLPMKVRFGDVEYLDAATLTHREFYEKLESSKTLPTTSQIPPTEFEDAMRKIVDDGDEAIVITISSKLSGTYQSACIAAGEFDGKVHVVDSLNVCIGQRLLTLRALAMIQQGLSANEITDALNEEKKHIKLYALLDTLEYLKKGGRISATTAFAGELLSIKPIIAVEDGAVSMAGKARGSKQGNKLLRQLVNDCGGINFDKPFACAYSGLDDTMVKKYVEDGEEFTDKESVSITTVGCSIGTHVGPGAVAIAFFKN